MTTVVIAEAGVNHNGNIDLALKLVDAAAAAGADFVKFQTFRAEAVASARAAKAAYQSQHTGGDESQLDMIRKLELDHAAHHRIVERCRARKIAFLSTAFDLESLDFLARDLALDLLKLPSGEITNGPYLLAAARTGRKLIVSTGMANLGEIEQALAVLAYGFLDAGRRPTAASLQEAWLSAEGQAALAAHVTLLHCTTAYPAAPKEINLRAMATLRQAFSLPVGFSDHSEGIAIPAAAVALGAVMVEKHFTLDRRMEGPDHAASLEPIELIDMVRGIRAVEAALGDGKRLPLPVERTNAAAARKSLVALKPISKGEAYSADNLGVKRPGTGRSPMLYWDMLGQSAENNIDPDDLV